jgi:hypothetical protein
MEARPVVASLFAEVAGSQKDRSRERHQNPPDRRPTSHQQAVARGRSSRDKARRYVRHEASQHTPPQRHTKSVFQLKAQTHSPLVMGQAVQTLLSQLRRLKKTPSAPCSRMHAGRGGCAISARSFRRRARTPDETSDRQRTGRDRQPRRQRHGTPEIRQGRREHSNDHASNIGGSPEPCPCPGLPLLFLLLGIMSFQRWLRAEPLLFLARVGRARQARPPGRARPAEGTGPYRRRAGPRRRRDPS